jgi:hypothetical protein
LSPEETSTPTGWQRSSEEERPTSCPSC